MQLKMSLRGEDLGMWLLQNKNSVVICLEERERFLFPWGLSAPVLNRPGYTWEELVLHSPSKQNVLQYSK